MCDIYLLLCVQCCTPDDEQRNCPKHVEAYSKNKFEKLVLLVGFIIRITNSRFRHILLVYSYPFTLRRNLQGLKLQNKCSFNFFQDVRKLNLLQFLCVCVAPNELFMCPNRIFMAYNKLSQNIKTWGI